MDLDEFTQITHPTTYLETLMHILKANVATGLFAMGDAVKNSGLALSPFLIVILGILCTYCEHLLLNACTELKNELSMEGYPDFAATVKICFSNGPEKIQKYAANMYGIVNTFLCLSQLCTCCIYIVFAASTTRQILMYHGYDYDIRLIMVVLMIFIVPICLIRNLKFLVPISTLANLFLFTGAAICIYYAIKGLHIHETVKYIAPIHRLPLFFGTVVFGFESISAAIPLKMHMKHPELFDSPFGVLNVGKCCTVAISVIMGLFSYMKYGEEIQGSVTLNIPEDKILALTVKILTAIAILLTYPIQYYVLYHISFIWFIQPKGPFRYPLLVDIGFRLASALLTFVLSEAIPYLNLIIPLAGAISSSALAFLFPPVLEYVLAWRNERLTAWITIKDILIVCVGVLGIATGTYQSVQSIVEVTTNTTDT